MHGRCIMAIVGTRTLPACSIRRLRRWPCCPWSASAVQLHWRGS